MNVNEQVLKIISWGVVVILGAITAALCFIAIRDGNSYVVTDVTDKLTTILLTAVAGLIGVYLGHKNKQNPPIA